MYKCISIYLYILWTANNALILAVFLLIFLAHHVTFYSVVEKPTLPQFVFNSLILYNNLSILCFVWGVSAKISYLNITFFISF